VTQARPDSGQAQVAGADVVKNPTEVRRRIGYVPQEITVDRYLTAREQLSLFADLYHIPRQRRPRRIEPKPLAEASAWIEEYREIWEANFQRLDVLLEELQRKPAKRVRRKK